MSIIDVVKRARLEPPFAPASGIFPDKRYVCKVFDPIAWDRSVLEQKLGVEIPPDLAALWDSCGGLILYEDNIHRQWGLVVAAPSDSNILRLNREYHEDWPSGVLPGDLVIGRFWGDRERPLMRCDKNAADYGAIMIVAEMDPRPEWYKAGGSLEEFLVRFMDAHGGKYWEYHYKKKVAEGAAEDLLRSRRMS